MRYYVTNCFACVHIVKCYIHVYHTALVLFNQLIGCHCWVCIIVCDPSPSVLRLPVTIHKVTTRRHRTNSEFSRVMPHRLNLGARLIAWPDVHSSSERCSACWQSKQEHRGERSPNWVWIHAKTPVFVPLVFVWMFVCSSCFRLPVGYPHISQCLKCTSMFSITKTLVTIFYHIHITVPNPENPFSPNNMWPKATDVL